MQESANNAKKFVNKVEDETAEVEKRNKAFDEAVDVKEVDDVINRDKTTMVEPDDIEKALNILESKIGGIEKDVKTASQASQAAIEQL